MYTTKSFCNVGQFLSNVPGVVSPIGEISTHGLTYSREYAIYHHTSIDGYDLVNLRSVNDGTKIAMDQTLVDQAIELVQIAVNRTITTAGEIIYDEMLAELTRNATRLKASGIKIGAMVQHGQYWVPSSITWTDSSDARQNVHRIWLSLEHFLNQYTDYEIVVVPPFEPLDGFFAAPTVVKNRLDAITPTQMMDAVNAARGDHPPTIIRTLEFMYHDTTYPDRQFKSFWSAVIYGLSGDNPDSIKDALVEHILANSTYSRKRWEEIFPDIFKRTEFVIAPHWLQYSATTSQLRHGIYSPLLRSGDQVPAYVRKIVPGYAAAHVNANTISTFFPYRSLAISTIGNAENRDGKFLLTDYFPDYMAVPTNDTDFNRMSTFTMEWIFKLLDAILQAEEWYDGYDLKKGYYRIERDDVTFVGFTYENIQYLVLTKESAVVKGV